ncbi:MFS transporter [Pseudomonas sp. HS6]|uniref:MFS transporter n=1 Tax=Pseudomonas sp. HS6 TaxID=2850559 RepID=UPI002018590A|nr:MFS transporter [Pseudomonas sp. HS6]UQS17176.1 MFS transporter [Pseudomonas sp. HS6]
MKIQALVRISPFKRMWSAMFLSMLCSFAIMIAVSIHLFHGFHSTLLASGIYAVQFGLPVLFVGLAGWLCQRVTPVRLLITVEVLSFIAFATLATWIETLLPIIVLTVFLRGFAEIIIKSTRAKLVKHLFSPAILTDANTWMMTSYYLGSALGGALGAWLYDRYGVQATIYLCAPLSLVAATLYRGLPAVETAQGAQENATRVFSSCLQLLARQPQLVRPLTVLTLSVVVFQGAHLIARSWIPMTHLQLSQSGVGVFHCVSVFGIFLGALFVTTAWFKNNEASLSNDQTFTLGLAAMAVPFLITSAFFVIPAYFVFMFIFEVAFMRAYNELLMETPAEDISVVMVTFHSLAPLGMALVAVTGGYAIDHVGALPVIAGLVIFAFFILCSARWLSTRPVNAVQ